MAGGADRPIIAPVLPQPASHPAPVPPATAQEAAGATVYALAACGAGVQEQPASYTTLLGSKARKHFKLERKESQRNLQDVLSEGLHGRSREEASSRTCHTWKQRGAALGKGRGCAQTHARNKSVRLQWLPEEKVKTKQKFLQFLDEVNIQCA